MKYLLKHRKLLLCFITAPEIEVCFFFLSRAPKFASKWCLTWHYLNIVYGMRLKKDTG